MTDTSGQTPETEPESSDESASSTEPEHEGRHVRRDEDPPPVEEPEGGATHEPVEFPDVEDVEEDATEIDDGA
jgi:hypothetical protein